MSALPWMKFNPNDWRGSTKLGMTSLAARGLWIEILCIMHDAEPYGHLLVEGHRPTVSQLASIVGKPEQEVKPLLDELLRYGVAKYARDGETIVSERMVKDAARSQKARASGLLGGNPNLGKKTENEHSLNGDEKGPEKATAEGFDYTRGRVQSRQAPSAPPRQISELREEVPSSLRSDGPKTADRWTEILGIEEPGKRAWTAAIFVLADQGGVADKSARSFLGKVRKTTGFEDVELFEAAKLVRANGTMDPQPLMKRTVEGIVAKRGERPAPEAAPQLDPNSAGIFRKIIRDWKANPDDWPASRGPTPDSPLCRYIPASILAEFGYGPAQAEDIGNLFE